MTRHALKLQQEFQHLEAARRSGVFLSKVEALISESLDERGCISKAVRSAVPFLADVCFVVFLPQGEDRPELELAWRYPEEARAAETLRAQFTNSSGQARALSLATSFGAGDSLTLPLGSSREKRWGAITFLSTASGRRFLQAERRLLEDFTERVSTALQNCRLYSETRQAIIDRVQFISIASHEMRSPLTAFQLQFQMLERTLKESQLPDRAHLLMRSMNVSLAKMKESVSKLFDATRIQSGHFALERRPVRLDELLAELVERLAPSAERVGCELSLRSEQSIEGLWDAHRIEQAISNLLFNAFKYAPGHPIELGLARQGDQALLTVRDHGPGVHPSDQVRIFEMFRRGDSRGREIGTGLGLYITRSIVLAHGGQIRLESMPGHGAEFILLLPLVAPDEAPGAESSAQTNLTGAIR